MFTKINLLLLVAFAVVDLMFLLVISSGIGIVIIILSQVTTGSIGIYFLRKMDFNLFFYIDATLKNKEPIVKELWGELLILSGACLLVVPGFLSDIIGILIIIPETRKLINEVIENI